LQSLELIFMKSCHLNLIHVFYMWSNLTPVYLDNIQDDMPALLTLEMSEIKLFVCMFLIHSANNLLMDRGGFLTF